MKRIAIDMDGVMADVVELFLDYHERDFGYRKSIEEINGLSEREAFPKAKEYVHAKGFFRNARVMEGSREVMEQLQQQYEIFIVSAATEFPQSLQEKQEWLQEHFPFIGWQQMVFCGLKTIITADIMIDDRFRNLDPFKGDTILFSQHHNLLKEPGRHRRVHSWAEISRILLP
jgi:5'(3')-deoxyribonucleotidase